MKTPTVYRNKLTGATVSAEEVERYDRSSAAGLAGHEAIEADDEKTPALTDEELAKAISDYEGMHVAPTTPSVIITPPPEPAKPAPKIVIVSEMPNKKKKAKGK